MKTMVLPGLLTRLTLFTFVSLFVLSCTAQSVWEASEVKGKTSVFKCFTVDDKLQITNKNYIDPKQHRSEYDINRLDFSYVSMVSYNAFIDAFKASFTASRITQLAKVNDFVSLIINVDEQGQILGIYFSLDKGTTILPEELEILEQKLLSKVKFVVIGKKVEELVFYRVPFSILFTEVQNGEIRSVRNSVNLKNKYKN
jgi:hypothetical protein